MYIDKGRAIKNQYRISEKTIWTISFLGGAAGALLGMKWFKHKTKHFSFKWGLPSLTIFQIFSLVYALITL